MHGVSTTWGFLTGTEPQTQYERAYRMLYNMDWTSLSFPLKYALDLWQSTHPANNCPVGLLENAACSQTRSSGEVAARTLPHLAAHCEPEGQRMACTAASEANIELMSRSMFFRDSLSCHCFELCPQLSRQSGARRQAPDKAEGAGNDIRGCQWMSCSS